jgi:type IV fimbrial biogenesis protein FimT
MWYPKRRCPERGFTLIELMIALFVASILLAVATPSFRSFRDNNRMTGIGNDFLSAVLHARTEAIKRQVPVSICPATSAAGPCTAGAFTGWIVFSDPNGNCTLDGGEPVFEGKASIDGATDGYTFAKSNGTCLSFAPTGFLQANATATRTLFCDSRGLSAVTGTTLSAGRGLLVTATGRASVTRDRSSGTVNDITTWGLTCP